MSKFTLVVPSRPTGPIVDPYGAERRGARRLRGTVEDLFAPGDLEVLEACASNHCLELCFQQSTGNSPGPQIDIVLGASRDLPRNQDVADLDAAAGL